MRSKLDQLEDDLRTPVIGTQYLTDEDTQRMVRIYDAARAHLNAQRQGGDALTLLRDIPGETLYAKVKLLSEWYQGACIHIAEKAHPPAVTVDVNDINVADMAQVVDNAGGHTAVTGDRGALEALDRISGMCDVSGKCACGRPNGIPAVKACADKARAALLPAQAGVPTMHTEGIAQNRELCRELYQKMQRDAMLRQNDPVQTLHEFVMSVWSEGFSEGFDDSKALPGPVPDDVLKNIHHRIKQIADQCLSGKMDQYDRDNSDFEFGYDECVLMAREALALLSPYLNTNDGRG